MTLGIPGLSVPDILYYNQGMTKTTFLACAEVHKFVYCTKSEKKKFANILKLEEINLPDYSFFVRHWYWLHPVLDWKIFALQFQTYMIQEEARLNDAVAFVCAALLGCPNGVQESDGSTNEEDKKSEVSGWIVLGEQRAGRVQGSEERVVGGGRRGLC